MKEIFVNYILPILVTIGVPFLGWVIKVVASELVLFIITKKKNVEQSLIASGHEEQLKTAKAVWHIVEEQFRITENAKSVLGSKSKVFDEMLLGKIPSLKQEDLDYLRQTIAGEFNKGKETVETSDTSNYDNIIKQLQDEKIQLQNELNNSKMKLEQIKSVTA